jgi:hypothetical protein
MLCGEESVFKKLLVTQVIEIYLPFMDPKGSLSCSKELPISPHLKRSRTGVDFDPGAYAFINTITMFFENPGHALKRRRDRMGHI